MSSGRRHHHNPYSSSARSPNPQARSPPECPEEHRRMGYYRAESLRNSTGTTTCTTATATTPCGYEEGCEGLNHRHRNSSSHHQQQQQQPAHDEGEQEGDWWMEYPPYYDYRYIPEQSPAAGNGGGGGGGGYDYGHGEEVEEVSLGCSSECWGAKQRDAYDAANSQRHPNSYHQGGGRAGAYYHQPRQKQTLGVPSLRMPPAVAEAMANSRFSPGGMAPTPTPALHERATFGEGGVKGYHSDFPLPYVMHQGASGFFPVDPSTGLPLLSRRRRHHPKKPRGADKPNPHARHASPPRQAQVDDRSKKKEQPQQHPPLPLQKDAEEEDGTQQQSNKNSDTVADESSLHNIYSRFFLVSVPDEPLSFLAGIKRSGGGQEVPVDGGEATIRRGSHVLIPVDRGTELGVVEHEISLPEVRRRLERHKTVGAAAMIGHKSSSSTSPSRRGPQNKRQQQQLSSSLHSSFTGSLVPVVRVATEEDLNYARGELAREADCCASEVKRLMESKFDRLHFEGCRYQFDKSRFIVRYTLTGERVYFVALLRLLYQHVKTRVWMVRVEGGAAGANTTATGACEAVQTSPSLAAFATATSDGDKAEHTYPRQGTGNSDQPLNLKDDEERSAPETMGSISTSEHGITSSERCSLEQDEHRTDVTTAAGSSSPSASGSGIGTPTTSDPPSKLATEDE